MLPQLAQAVVFGAILLSASAQAQEMPARVQDVPEPALENEPVAPVGEKEGTPAGKQDAAPEQDSALDLLPAIQGIESAIRGLVAEEDEIEREAERRRNEADLRAQQSMARWAFWTMLAAGASVFLTAVGVFLIWRTLHHTHVAAKAAVDTATEARKSTGAAVRAAGAAGEANNINRNAFIAQHRAWLAPGQVKIMSALEWEGNSGRITFEFRFRNTRDTPARNIHLVSEVHPGHSLIADRFFEEVSEKARKWSSRMGVTIFPGDELVAVQTPIIDDAAIEGFFKIYGHEMAAVNLILVICADYGLVIEQERRRTGLIFDIKGKQVGRGYELIGPGRGNTPAESLRLIRSPFGNGVIAD